MKKPELTLEDLERVKVALKKSSQQNPPCYDVYFCPLEKEKEFPGIIFDGEKYVLYERDKNGNMICYKRTEDEKLERINIQNSRK